MAELEQLVARMEAGALPLEQLLLQSEQTMQSTEILTQNAAKMVAQLDALIANPHLQQLPAQLQQSLQDLQHMLSGLSPGAPAYDNLNGNLQTLDQVLRELQPVLHTLNQQSNALVFEAETAADPQPKRAKQ